MPTLKRQRGLISALLAFMLVAPLASLAPGGEEAAATAKRTVAVIPLDGLIDKGLLDSVKRRVADSRALDPAMLVFRIDTYGGFLDAAIEITDEIGGIEKPKTVAFIPTKAFSAGAMIAMGAREIVLTGSSSLGDAAPVIDTPEGPTIIGEKAQSPVRSVFRKYAQRNGYPSALVEAMVTPELEVVAVTYKDGTIKYMISSEFEDLPEEEKANVEKKRVVVREGELLTATAEEALEYGLARFIVRDMDELLERYSLAGATIEVLDINWSESLVRFLNYPWVAAIILLLGIIGIYMEFKVPGFGLPGTIGIICFAIFFFSKYLSGLAQYWEILLFIVGLVLLGIEIFLIPGFGITGFLGITFIILGLALSLVPSHITTAPLDVSFLARSGAYFVATLVAAFITAAALAKLLPKTPVIGKFFLGEPAPESIAHSQGAGLTEGKASLVGKVGRAETPLRPAGRAAIGGEYYDVTTEGDMVARGASVEVIAIRGNNIVVRESK